MSVIIDRRVRLAATIYTCAVCGACWSPIKLAPNPPKYCSRPCSARANYARGKAANKSWALRTKEHRRDRKGACP